MTHLLSYIINEIKKYNLRHETHRFPSGAIIVDIWINDEFHVIQVDNDSIGLSLITKDTTPFDVTPDQSFSKEEDFKHEFSKIF